MSDVTNVILTYPLWDEERVAAINEFFEDSRGFLRLEDPHYGGTKRLECTILVGAFNYLDLPGLVAHVRSLSWRAGPEGRYNRADQVQMFVQKQDDSSFRSLYVCDPEVPEKDDACDACRSDMPSVVFDREHARFTLCRSHLMQLLDSRARS